MFLAVEAMRAVAATSHFVKAYLNVADELQVIDTKVEPSGRTPCCVLTIMDVQTNVGGARAHASVETVVVEAKVWALSPEKARQIATVLQEVWDGYVGNVQIDAGTVQAVHVIRRLAGQVEDWDDERELYSVAMVFEVAGSEFGLLEDAPWEAATTGSIWVQPFGGHSANDNPLGAAALYWNDPAKFFADAEAFAELVGAKRAILHQPQCAVEGSSYGASLWYALPAKQRTAIMRHGWRRRQWELYTGKWAEKTNNQRGQETIEHEASWGFIYRSVEPMRRLGFTAGYLDASDGEDMRRNVLRPLDRSGLFRKPWGGEDLPIVQVSGKYVLDDAIVRERPWIATWEQSVQVFPPEDVEDWTVPKGAQCEIVIPYNFEALGGTLADLDMFKANGFLVSIWMGSSEPVQEWFAAAYGA
jgi:hypothetical protein